MNNVTQLQALYKANNVPGRGKFCPRIGTYRIVEIYKDTCYGKQALIASANWKPNPSDHYNDDFVVQVQLESFTGEGASDKENWQHREVMVTHATYEKDKQQFTLKWSLLPIRSISIDALNKLLASGDDTVANSLLEATTDVHIDEDLMDFNEDIDLEY